MDLTPDLVTNNKKLFRFEITLPDGEAAFTEYRWLKGNMVLMRTFVPASGRGKGIGEVLVRAVLAYVREYHLKVIAYCHFSAAYLKDHPEYNDLVASV